MSHRTDEQLVSQYLRNDEQALEILIQRYLKPIYSFVYQYVSNEQEAEDITQEVFIKAWRNLKKFDPQRKFKTWIFTIAKNTCFDWWKKKRAIPFSIFDNKEGFSLARTIQDPDPLPNELLERKNLKTTLNKALETLSSKYRLVLSLRYNNDFTFREIAEILEEPINTIQSRYRRGVTLLRKRFV